MMDSMFPDMAGFSKRSDGQYRTDAAQAYHEAYLAELRADHERAALTANLCSADPLLKSLDNHLNRAGISSWNERYLIIADLNELIEVKIASAIEALVDRIQDASGICP